jgi:hypothetical protein
VLSYAAVDDLQECFRGASHEVGDLFAQEGSEKIQYLFVFEIDPDIFGIDILQGDSKEIFIE